MAEAWNSGSTSTTRSENQLLLEVVNSFAESPDPRLGEIMRAVATHLHQLVEELGVTQAEWKAAIDFLTATGHACTETRQEFILLSDVLGVSSLVERLNFAVAEGATENTVLGPFYVPDSPIRDFGASILENTDPGERLLIQGRVTDPSGRPVPGAMLDVWQNASNRLYAVQDHGQHPNNLRGRFVARDDGAFEFRTIRPIPYPVPDDGPVGGMLHAAGRHPWRAAHLHIIGSAPGYRTLTTHIFDAESDYLDSDTVFGVRDSLVVSFETSPEELLARFDIVLAPEAAP